MRKIIHFFDKDGSCWRYETAQDRLADELDRVEKEKKKIKNNQNGKHIFSPENS